MDRLDELFELIKSTLDRVEKMESNFQDLIGAVNDARNEYDTNERRNGFRERNASAFEKYQDKLKAIEGDDFDVCDKAFEEFDGMKDKIEEADYIAALCAKIDAQLDKIAEAYGVQKVEAEKEGETTEVKTEEDGVVAEVVEGEPAEENESEESNESTQEQEEEKDDILVEEEEEQVDSEEEIEADLKELEEELKKYR